jgi:NADPH:quinone reductase-like Zn-dependent oxidoreductase
MKAVVRARYGPPDVLELREVERPILTADRVLVRVRASSVNRGDWYELIGRPYVARPSFGLVRPKSPLLGTDFAGVVEAVGDDVHDLQPGDEVFGLRGGAFAEFVSVRDGVALKPVRLSFEEAAAVPVAALTAMQGLREHGGLAPGQKVLINGASGGVGTFAVQIAKALGANVTAVCSTRNVDQARMLGAERVVDYTSEDFTRNGGPYDVLLDIAGGRSWSELKRVLSPEGTLVIIGAQAGSGLLGPLGHVLAVRLTALRDPRNVRFFIAKPNRPDLASLRGLIEEGKVRPVVERRYELSEIADALRQMGEGHVQGKLVVTV